MPCSPQEGRELPSRECICPVWRKGTRKGGFRGHCPNSEFDLFWLLEQVVKWGRSAHGLSDRFRDETVDTLNYNLLELLRRIAVHEIPRLVPSFRMAHLFACSKCFKRFPFEELSQGDQLCKVSTLRFARRKLMSFKSCISGSQVVSNLVQQTFPVQSPASSPCCIKKAEG